LAAVLRPDPLGNYSAPPDAVTVIRGKGGWGKREDRVEDKSGEEEER